MGAEVTSVRGRRLIVSVAGLLAGWAALAAWQQHEYGHECELVRQSLQRQAESVMNALVGGIQSHRRMGRFFAGQLQGALNQLVSAEDILAAAVTSDDGQLVLNAGQADLLELTPPITPGTYWEAGGLRYVVDFQVSPDTEGGPPGLGGGGGWGGGRGGGRGLGNPTHWAQQSPFAAGGRFIASLLLDRTHVDVANGRALWLRIWVVAAGGLVLLCAIVAWWATVGLVEARGRATILEAEARHLRDFGQAAAGLAHETRNPLGLIRGWAQRLADSGLRTPEQGQQARAVIEECDRVVSRINQFLAFAKPCRPTPASVDLDRLIGELCSLLEPDLDAKELRLEHPEAGLDRMVRADGEMLRQALFNLIRNAIQFSPEEGTVAVVVSKGQNGCRRIEVVDRGPGVPQEKVDLLFTPYFTTREGGTGLGLAIVHRIAMAHGWQSGYTARPGGGSIFWLDRIHD